MTSPPPSSAPPGMSFDPEDRLQDKGMHGPQEPSQEMTLFVQDLLDQMQSRFKTMGDSIMGRMDEMGGRLDELEKSISSLMDQAGLQPTTGVLAPPREGAEKQSKTSAGSDGSVDA